MRDPVKEFVEAQAGKNSSSKRQARIVGSGFIEYTKKLDPPKWSKNDVFGYLSNIEPDHSRSTLYNYAVQLRAFLRYHGREDLAKLVKPPRRAEILRVVPSDEEVARMIVIASNPRDRLIVQILGRTGLRVGELCHLNVSDIDLDNRQIRIRARGMWAPKNLKERTVPFDSETAEQIKSYIKGVETSCLFDLSESYVRHIVKDLAFQQPYVMDEVYYSLYITSHACESARLSFLLNEKGDFDICTIFDDLVALDLRRPAQDIDAP